MKKTCKLWNDSINKYLEIKEIPELNKRVFNICYEDLVENPKPILIKMFAFLNLPFDEKLLEPEKLDLDNSKNKAHINNIWYTNEMYNQSYNKKNIDKWKNKLSSRELMVANLLMGDNLHRLGYEIDKKFLKASAVTSKFSKSNIKKIASNNLFFNSLLKLKRKII